MVTMSVAMASKVRDECGNTVNISVANHEKANTAVML